MTTTPNEYLSRAITSFKAEKISDKQWRGTCPICGHQCLLLSKGTKQPVTAWCSKDCDKKAVNAALYKAVGLSTEPFTVERFCKMKKLPLEWVRAWFCVINAPFVSKKGRVSKDAVCAFPYLPGDAANDGWEPPKRVVLPDQPNNPAYVELGPDSTPKWRCPVKFRFSEDSHKTAWLDYHPMLYGMHTIKLAKENGIDTSVVTLVEGESDTITLSYHGVFALGVQGAPHGWRTEFAQLPVLRDAKKILIVQEPGEAGQKLVQRVAASFPAGKVWAIHLPAKDPSELWCQLTEEQFRAAWNKAATEALPVGSAPESGQYTLEKMSAIVPKAITWMWPGRIPRGKVTVFAGNPGVGKGLATCSIAAIVTKGGTYPDENVPMTDRMPEDVLMMFCEDDADDTVVPRLIAAGADLDRIARPKIMGAALTENSKREEREFAFDSDLAILKKILSDHPRIKLVIVDPITSYLGEAKPTDEKEVRRVLIPLADVARETGVTFVLVAHFNKRSDVSALHKILGAVAMTGVARAAWLFAEDTESEDPENPKYLMLQGKLNVGRRQKGLEYTIPERPVPLPDGETTAVGVIEWGEATDKTADSALGSMGAFGDESGSKVKAAGEWLAQFLAGGDQPVDTIKDVMPKGIGWRTMNTAKKALGVVSKRVDDKWWWHLPVKQPVNDGFTLQPCVL